MLQEHLSALAQISIKQEVTRSVNKDELIRAFSALKLSRADYSQTESSVRVFARFQQK